MLNTYPTWTDIWGTNRDGEDIFWTPQTTIQTTLAQYMWFDPEWPLLGLKHIKLILD